MNTSKREIASSDKKHRNRNDKEALISVSVVTNSLMLRGVKLRVFILVN